MTVTRRLLAIFWAISQILCFLTTILVVGVVRVCACGFLARCTPTLPSVSMLGIFFQCDVCGLLHSTKAIYKWPWETDLPLSNFLKVLSLPFIKQTMTENVRRALQDIDLGSNDAPFVLPSDVVSRAAEENRFILVGRPSMPRKQNLRGIIATMPRIWGLDGLVRGRVMEGRRFQFIFPSEEAMETVIRRGPWAYADRMLTLQKWTPLMDMELLNFIPFWIQVRGIPFQYMNREVVIHIARLMGQYIQVDYNEEAGGRLEFVRFRLNWDISQPLKFQRNFQFTPGVNTLLKFHYERLRGFCEVCGMITHDSGRCLIQNGGPEEGLDDENDEGDDEQGPGDQPHGNVGVLIEEINNADNIQGVDDNVPEAPDGVNDGQDHMNEAEDGDEKSDASSYTDDEEFWNPSGKTSLFSEEFEMEEMFSITPFADRRDGRESLKRKAWMANAENNKMMLSKKITHIGETSKAGDAKRKKKDSVLGATEDAEGKIQEGDGDNTLRGAVGPEPPLPP